MDENGGLNACDNRIPRYKRRKISSKRDFPLGCGHKVLTFNVRDNKNSNVGLSKMESANGLKDVSNLDSYGVDVGDLLTSKNFELKKGPNGVTADSTSFLNFHSQPKNSTIESNILVRTLTRKYPPRRRISAFRRFPLHFERDVPQHNKGNHIKAQASFDSGNMVSHVIVQNEDVKSNHSNSIISLESGEALKAESTTSNKLKDEWKSSEVKGSQFVKLKTGNKFVDSNVNFVDLDSDTGEVLVVCEAKTVSADSVVPSAASGSCGQYPHASDNSVSRESVLVIEDHNLSSVSSHALDAQPVTTEVINLDDECSRSEYSFEKANNKVIVCALMAAQNSPWMNSKVAGLNSSNGLRKSDRTKSRFINRNKKNEVNKERKVLPSKEVAAKGDGKASFKQDEGCDTNFVSWKILEDRKKYTNTSQQNVRPVPMQLEPALNVGRKSRRSDFRHGICLQDISEGKEPIPIRVINSIDDQKPPPFKYITSMVYPDWCRPLPLRGCNCTGGCSASSDCACTLRNGGKLPFDSDGCIDELKSHGLVYECGPSCTCPPSCPNRVSQFGIRFPLEIFKTESRGWGVRSRKYIPSGSFICEYLGELLEDKEAELRVDNDEYLYDIKSSFTDSEDMEMMDDGGFTIDAKHYGNVGRFINHSCSPNLYPQNVLYDHENRRVAHIMFFADEDIPPLQELTFNYNYNIGEVLDANGNVKIKQCFCGSEECTGRMY